MSDKREAVRRHYSAAAVEARGCCSVDAPLQEEKACCGSPRYAAAELEGSPDKAVALSLGCANPVAAAELRAGEAVLDLGSGGGLDVLLSARRVAPGGKAYGLDMTDEMLAVAEENRRASGLDNVEFLKGYIEDIPLPPATVDVVLSNCVINLSVDKTAAFGEMYRVLRPGGRIAVADIVADQELGREQRSDLAAWTACMAGALTREQYVRGLEEAGFTSVSIEDSHEVARGFSSVVVRAAKPAPAGP